MKTASSTPPKDREGKLFENVPIDTEVLPDIEKIPFHPLEKKYQQMMYGYAVPASIAIGFCAGLTAFGNPLTKPYAWWIGISTMTLFFLLRCLYIHFAFPVKGYALRQRDIVYRSGWMVQTVTVIPFERIQHSEWRQGVLEQFFGLAKLKIFTAGGSGSDLSIPGLTKKKSKQLRGFYYGKSKW